MKRAIFKKFIIILTLALLLSGSIFSAVMSKIIMDRTRENMLYALRVADFSLDYTKDLKSQVDQFKNIKENKSARFTVMDMKGNILADSDVRNSSTMANHADREEVKEVLKYGTGAAIRISDTLKINMFYVACTSRTGNHILRIAVPFTGITDYAGLLLPAIFISIGVTLVVSVVLAERFSKSVTRPLNDIAEELVKLKDESPEPHFKHYQYDEMNVIADTTMHMAEAVKKSRQQIEFEKMVRQEFFSNVSHELKTPITSIRGYIELLENGMASSEDMKQEFFSRIKRETVNMTNLINDILMISRLETKEAEVVISEVRLCPLVKEVCTSLEPLAKECRVTVETNCWPLTMNANPQQLRELFSNLITNAIKYNKLDGKVFVTVTLEGREIVIIVEDTGVGIPEEAKQRVFERFYRVDKGRSKKVGGTGLGLSIVKHIVGYYNGTIELESKLSEGTKFTVRLPVKPNQLKEKE
jgi:two-component system phosphate regulon sensor histidine kinase PhoR